MADEPPAEAVLRVSHLVKAFGANRAVDDVSFTVAPGETYGLLGPNGAGKSTAISMVAGLLEPDSGEVLVQGQRITTTSTTARSAIGLVPQDIAVYPDLTARENLRFFGRLYGLGRDDLTGRVDQVLEVIGLADRADDRSGEFSGGMQRRLNIGVGLLHRPQLLILDEPTVGVDPQSRNAILDAVERLSGEGVAVLYTTHYMEEAERLCDRIGIIDEGRLRTEGTRQELTTAVGERDRVRLRTTAAADEVVATLAAVDGVDSVAADGDGITFLADDAGAVVAQAIDAVSRAGGSVTGLEIDQPDLEAVFLHLTGKALRN